VETVINDYISRELVPDAALLPLANDTSLLDSGILDSLSLLRLVVFLEERFGITMGDADLLPENFASVNAICAYLSTRENVLDHCRRWLPGYMVPDIVEVREEMPRTSTGKVDRAGLAQEQNELESAGDGRRKNL